ncbi:NF-kappa-B inhibitor zeta-like [Bufo gargarizans]|uniref:NF-kappa-B inhibitor zeta-like n=1 Tax=Bufo gargarizans TaxID=30331 RepID=UPI001CF23EB4|nr:NF-kappa-B inhibitor zeta-like [Bufo gargarizans]
MILERVIEDSTELLDQEWLNSPMNLGYFYGGSPSSDTATSPSHSISSGPCSPTSDSEGSLSASWPRTKAGQASAAGRQSKGSFQGVRVKNSVRELLTQMRNKAGQEIDDVQKCRSQEPYTELKNILSQKRANDFILDAPAAKKVCTYQSSSFLTPPSTPNPGEIMDDASKNEMSGDSNLDLLSLINIKNESQPVSLNTVRVDWNMHTQGQYYQQAAQSFSPPQAFNGSSPQHTNDQYQIGVPQNVSPQCAGDYNTYTQSEDYQEILCSNDVFDSCSIDSYLSLIESTPEIPVMPAESVLPGFSLPADPPCNQFLNHNVAQPTPNLSPPASCHVEVNQTSPFQVGKSFFQWQIEQEEKKLANVSPEQLLSKDADGDTCLHIAVAQGRRALSYVIAQKMASICMLDIKEHNNQSALQVAVAADQHLIVQDLVSLGAQVNTTDHWGRTPIHVCAEKGYPQVLQAIQKSVAARNQYLDVDETNYDGLTPLHCAVIAHNAIVQRLQFGAPARDDLLMKNKAMVDTVKTLLQMGASVESRDRKSGRTALHLACEEANLELMSLFLELPNSLHFINAKAYNGNTALHIAASLQSRRAHVGAVRLLMRKGADPSARNLENEQPVHLVPDGAVGEEIRRVLKGKAMQQRSPSY